MNHREGNHGTEWSPDFSTLPHSRVSRDVFSRPASSLGSLLFVQAKVSMSSVASMSPRPTIIIVRPLLSRAPNDAFEHVRMLSPRSRQASQELGIRAACRTTRAAMCCKLQGIDELWGASQWRARRALKDLRRLWAMVHMCGVA